MRWPHSLFGHFEATKAVVCMLSGCDFHTIWVSNRGFHNRPVGRRLWLKADDSVDGCSAVAANAWVQTNYSRGCFRGFTATAVYWMAVGRHAADFENILSVRGGGKGVQFFNSISWDSITITVDFFLMAHFETLPLLSDFILITNSKMYCLLYTYYVLTCTYLWYF